MKPFIKTLFIALVGLLLFATPGVNVVAHATGLSPILSAMAVLAVTAVLYLVPSKNRPGVYVAGIQKEIWVNYIIERLFKNNNFLQYAWNDDDKVLAGKVVHIPNPGAAPVITVNRSSFPATAVRRTDTDITYSLNEYTTAPTHIENAEMVETSYDKINSVLGDHMGYLSEAVADNLLLSWLDESVTAPSKLFTTGALAAAVVDTTDTALTGTRRVLLASDVRRAMTFLNNQNIPKNDRYALIESNMYDQLLTDLSVTQYRDFSATADPKNGIIGKLYGFTILDRSTTVAYNSSNALNAYGAAGAATDSLASIFWHKDAVSRALGEVKVFSNVDRPEYYGDIYSALLRMGGRRRRGDDKGIVSMIQAAS